MTYLRLWLIVIIIIIIIIPLLLLLIIIILLIFRKWDVGVWVGSIWLRIGTGGEHL